MINYTALHAGNKEKKRLKAAGIRAHAWREAERLIDRRRYGDAWDCMVRACARAWLVEQGFEH